MAFCLQNALPIVFLRFLNKQQNFYDKLNMSKKGNYCNFADIQTDDFLKIFFRFNTGSASVKKFIVS